MGNKNTLTNSQIILNNNISISSYSSKGQSWIYWKGVNKYEPHLIYYINLRVLPTTDTYICLNGKNKTASVDTF